MSSLEAIELAEQKLYHADNTEIIEKKYEMILSAIELLKVALHDTSPSLPLTIEVAGAQKNVLNKEELIEFLRRLQTWLMKAKKEVDDDDMAEFLSIAKLALIQVIYKGIHGESTLVKLGSKG